MQKVRLSYKKLNEELHKHLYDYYYFSVILQSWNKGRGALQIAELQVSIELGIQVNGRQLE